jgi:hypothetical protein
MRTEDGDTASDRSALERALDEALATLADTDRGAAPEVADLRWLGVGLRLGVEQPAQARHLLELIEGEDAGGTGAAPGAAEDVTPGRDPDAGEAPRSAVVPVASLVLARSAAMPPAERAEVGPEVVFGWATGLAPGEILALGRVVAEMVAAGAPPDVGRGFGLAWDARVRIPRKERDAMLREFADLEISVGSVLVGRDLRAEEPAPPSRGLGAMFDQLVLPKNRLESQAGEVINRSGDPGRRGLVALWNAWVAMRYRAIIPAPTFELLVHPWVSVVGPLPEP